MSKILLRIVLVLVSVVATICLLFGGLVLFLTIFEYRPKDKEPLFVSQNKKDAVSLNEPLSLLSWNIGYCGLNDEVDFFMDGGKMVRGANRKQVNENIQAINSYINQSDYDFILLQEVDRCSTRTFRFNQLDFIIGQNPNYAFTFANNHKTQFVPFPFPPIGKVDAGIVSGSKFNVSNAERISLPVPFKWPIRVANLKRALLQMRLPIKDSDKELVLINLHLEAYDSGEGKVAQTKLLKEVLESERQKGNYVVAGGDFNQTFSSVNISKFPVYEGKWKAGQIDVLDFGEGFLFLMDEDTPSCRSLDQPYKSAKKDSFQFYIIDGFILSSNIQVNSFKIDNLDFKNSDHNPALLEIVLLNP